MLTQIEVRCCAQRFLVLVNLYSGEHTQRAIKRQISEPVEVALSKPNPRMWDSVLVVFGEKLNLAVSTYLVKAKSGWDVTRISAGSRCLRFQLHRGREYFVVEYSTKKSVAGVAR